jgi:hypothetical protein
MPNITDGLFCSGLLFLTGTDVIMTESTIFEILSKFGVVAVLWYWLRDLKSQLKNQLTEFRDETKEIREHYDRLMVDKTYDLKDHKDRIDKLLNETMNKEN